MRTIELIVSPDGQSRVETKGFSGSECRDASQFIEKTLGKHLEENLTPEFYAVSNNQQRLSEGQ